jgi:hypothetical protein
MDPLPHFLTYEMLQARTREQLRVAASLIEVRSLGQSRSGRPIELISIGSGERSALVVGAPHPNEPIGCLTIERLLDRLIQDEAFRANSGYRWHFIKAIDPDGLSLNGGWLAKPLTVESYLKHFFRPALRRQPEYTFPLWAGSELIDYATQENLCWRAALEMTKPDLQVSLHNADVGGVFYLISDNIADLATDLAQDPSRYGLTINSTGEPFSEMASFADGVFSFPDFAELARRRAAYGHPLSEVWPAGNSSEGYAKERFGTFSLVCEVPLWDSPHLRSRDLTPIRISDIAQHQIARNTDLVTVLDDHLPKLLSEPLSDDAIEMALAIHEAYQSVPRQNAMLSKYSEGGGYLNVARVAFYNLFLGLVSARPFGHLIRMTREVVRTRMNQAAVEVEVAAVEKLEFLIRQLHQVGALTPVNLDHATLLQMRAILKAAEAVAQYRS